MPYAATKIHQTEKITALILFYLYLSNRDIGGQFKSYLCDILKLFKFSLKRLANPSKKYSLFSSEHVFSCKMVSRPSNEYLAYCIFLS